MEKILIVGNGLTANLIPEYQHKAMMKKIKEEIPRLFDKADKLFAPFRNKVDSVQYSAVSWGYSGDGFCGEEGYGGPITDRPYNPTLLSHIEDQLRKLGFNDAQTVSTILFQTYGLIYETQNDEISNVESLLKIIELFCQRGDFTKEDQAELKRAASRICYNSMTRRSRFVCLLRLIFYIAEREMVLSSPSFLSGAGREKARQLPRFFLFLPARSFLKEGPPRC